jgi:hypothetical protein
MRDFIGTTVILAAGVSLVGYPDSPFWQRRCLDHDTNVVSPSQAWARKPRGGSMKGTADNDAL